MSETQGQGVGQGHGGAVRPSPAAPALSTLFLGTHTPRLDDKGRLILPAKFRERLAPGLVLTRGQERCLSVYPNDEFAQLAARLQQGSTTSRQVRDYTRVFLSGAYDEVPDRQGRLTIPPMLRSYAGLTRDCAVIGAGNHLEVWDQTSWRDYLDASEPAFAEQSEEVVPGVF